MEFVPGETCQQQLQRRGPLPAEQAARIACQVERYKGLRRFCRNQRRRPAEQFPSLYHAPTRPESEAERRRLSAG